MLFPPRSRHLGFQCLGFMQRFRRFSESMNGCGGGDFLLLLKSTGVFSRRAITFFNGFGIYLSLFFNTEYLLFCTVFMFSFLSFRDRQTVFFLLIFVVVVAFFLFHNTTCTV